MTFQQNDQRKQFVSVYSDFSLANSGQDLDPEMHSRLSFSYYRNCLKVAIAYRKPSSYDKEFAEYDNDNNSVIYIKPSKAGLLAREIDDLLSGKITTSCGIGSSNKIIVIAKESIKGHECFTLSIIELTDTATNKATYVFKKGFYDVIENFEFNDGAPKWDIEKNKYDNEDVEIFKNHLVAFYDAMNNAMAYSVSKANSKTIDSIEAIALKLGVQVGSQSKSANSYSNYNNRGKMDSTSKFKSKSLEDLESSIADE